jgi:hypothetical protein
MSASAPGATLAAAGAVPPAATTAWPHALWQSAVFLELLGGQDRSQLTLGAGADRFDLPTHLLHLLVTLRPLRIRLPAARAGTVRPLAMRAPASLTGRDAGLLEHRPGLLLLALKDRAHARGLAGGETEPLAASPTARRPLRSARH